MGQNEFLRAYKYICLHISCTSPVHRVNMVHSIVALLYVFRSFEIDFWVHLCISIICTCTSHFKMSVIQVSNYMCDAYNLCSFHVYMKVTFFNGFLMIEKL